LAEKTRDQRATLAGQRRDALDKRLPRIQLDVAPPATPPTRGAPSNAGKSALDVYRDGVRIDPASYGVPLPSDPGPHVLSVRRGADVLSSQQVNATEGQIARVSFDLAALERAPAPPAPSVPAQPGGKQKVVGYAFLGVGSATLATALGLEIAALVYRTTAFAADSCFNGFCTQAGSETAGRARTFANVGQWVGIAGIVVTTVGIVLVVTGPKRAAPPRAAVSVSGWAAPDGGGIGLRGVLR
jgi:hypothetical protein